LRPFDITRSTTDNRQPFPPSPRSGGTAEMRMAPATDRASAPKSLCALTPERGPPQAPEEEPGGRSTARRAVCAERGIAPQSDDSA